MYGHDTICPNTLLIVLGVYLCIDLVLIITTIIAFQNFIQHQHIYEQQDSDHEPLPKSLYYTGLIFIISTCLSLLFQISVLRECYPSLDENYMFTTIWLCGFVAYWIQYYLLIIHLYIRIEIIFDDTLFFISRKTRIIFIIIFILSIITCPISPLPWMVHDILFFGGGMCLFMILALSLTIIFIHKLIQIYKAAEQHIITDELQLESQPDNPEVIDNVIQRVSTHRSNADEFRNNYYKQRRDQQNDKILLSITKTFILAIISIVTSLLCTLYVVIYASKKLRLLGLDDTKKNVTIPMFYGIYLLDTYTNFICILLSFTFSAKWYYGICGRMDKCCQFCCKYLVLKSLKKDTLRGVVNKRQSTDTYSRDSMDENDEEEEEEPLVVL